MDHLSQSKSNRNGSIAQAASAKKKLRFNATRTDSIAESDGIGTNALHFNPK